MIGCGTHTNHYFYVSNPSVIVHQKNIGIWIDATFSFQDKNIIVHDIEEWNYVLNGEIVLKVVDTNFNMEDNKIDEAGATGGWIILKIDRYNSMIPKSQDGYVTLAFTDAIAGHLMFVVRDQMISNTMMQGVILHEMGHLLGAQHDQSGLMLPNYSEVGFHCVDEDAMKEVAEYWHLDSDHLNFCYQN